MNDKTEKKTLVEEGTEFVGTMRATCPIVVRGKIEGDVDAPAVSVAGSGSVSGNVKAKRVDSQGVLAGSVEADEVSLAGEVRSDTVIRARSLEVKLATEKGRLEVTFGECILDVGDTAEKTASIDDAAARAETTEREPAATLAPVEKESSPRANKKARAEAAKASEDAAERGEAVAVVEADAAAPA